MCKVREYLVEDANVADLDYKTAGEMAHYFSQFPEVAIFEHNPGGSEDYGDTYSVYTMREKTQKERDEEATDAQTREHNDHKKYLELKARFG